MINYAFLSACSRLRYIINTSRGYILDIRDLLRWTDESESRWASLDVLDQEEPTLFTAEEKSMFQRLVHHPRIFITPHIAGKSHSTRLKHARVLLKKLKDEYRSSH
jgi:D-3-phosphoglycerate dehydrogenase